MKLAPISLKLRKNDKYVQIDKKHGTQHKTEGTYIVKTISGRIHQRTLDKEGYIIHDFVMFDPDID